ncbi:restriction endonuclease subunit S [Streptococcus infantis]|uniref:restriction endonuclease subunit S n=1 Tax=Streptococcus infantis TaxID=68892 RepID=UPI0039C14AFB
MSEWRKKQLQEIAFLKPTETLKKGDIAPNIPMANIKEFQRDVVKIDYGEFRGGTKFRNGDTLLAKITPCLENGKTAFVNCLQEDEIGFGSTEFIVLRAKENIDERFLYYLSISPEFRKQAISLMEGTSGRKRVNENALKISDFLIPDLEEQRKIANILSAIDDKIQTNNQINQELEAMANSLYDYWFIQFDFPDQNGKPYKSSGGKMVYHPELKREIPEGWGVENLRDFESKIITGKTPSRANSDNFGGEIPFITIGDIRGNTFIYSTSESLTDLGASVQQNKYLPEGSLCVSCIATVGEIGFTTEWSHTNQQINSIVFEDETNRYYLYFALKNYFENANASAKTGNTFANMNKEDFSGIRIILPNKEIKNNFQEISEPYFAQIKCLQGQNQELTQLRDWLLPMLMNGQVKVE